MSLHQQLLDRLAPSEPFSENVYDALRVVIETHAPFQRSTLSVACRACSTPVHTQPGRYVTVVNWPCPTVQAIARELGVEVPS